MAETKTSKPSWRTSLSEMLTREKTRRQAEKLRVVVIGVGNEMNGDDAAGVAALRGLRERIVAVGASLLLLEGGLAPENLTGSIRAFGPDVVLLLDAVFGGGEPGQVLLLEADQIDGVSALTHSLPLSLLSKYLVHETGCLVGLIGIEAQSNQPGWPLSPMARRGVSEVVQGLELILTGAASRAS